jgi:hypothetical protein
MAASLKIAVDPDWPENTLAGGPRTGRDRA